MHFVHFVHFVLLPWRGVLIFLFFLVLLFSTHHPPVGLSLRCSYSCTKGFRVGHSTTPSTHGKEGSPSAGVDLCYYLTSEFAVFILLAVPFPRRFPRQMLVCAPRIACVACAIRGLALIATLLARPPALSKDHGSTCEACEACEACVQPLSRCMLHPLLV